MVILLPYKRNHYFTYLEFGLSSQMNGESLHSSSSEHKS
jgi:hypothetical protein